MKPDVRSFSALIGAAALAGELDVARRLFDTMAGRLGNRFGAHFGEVI